MDIQDYDYERDLEERVNRKYKPLSRIVWSGFFTAVVWVMMIVGMILGIIQAEIAIGIAMLSMLAPATLGILFAQRMIKLDLMEKEERRLAELAALEKRKNDERSPLRLSDEGEFVYFDDEGEAMQQRMN